MLTFGMHQTRAGFSSMIGVAAMAIVPVVVRAQAAAPAWREIKVDSAAPVHITLVSGRRVEARFISLTRQAITYSVRDSGSETSRDTTVERADVATAEARIAHQYPAQGLLAGGVVGLVTGAILGSADQGGCAANPRDGYCRGEAGLKAPAFALLGALLGLFVGQGIETEEWVSLLP